MPSKNRAETLSKYTYQWLKLMDFDWKIFVEPQDVEKYKDFQNVEVIPENDKGLGYVKEHIQAFCYKNGYDLVFKIDDDVKCFTNFRKTTKPEETAEMMNNFLKEKALPMFEKETLGAIAFPYSFEMYEKFEFEKTKRVQTSYICRVQYIKQKETGISVFEDFAVGLSILVDNRIILKCGTMGQNLGVKVGGGSGGLQDFDRSICAMREVELLRKIYPPLGFRKVDKPWKIEPNLRTVKL